MKLAYMDHMCPRDIVTEKSFENAIMVHAAISDSTNALMHVPAIAHEYGIEITGDTFDRLHRGPTTCSSALRDAGPLSSSTMPEASPPSWRRLRAPSIWMS